MSKLILNPEEFTHLKDRSRYNNNYYEHDSIDYIILEVCDDDSTFSYYLDGPEDIFDSYDEFLGCSDKSLSGIEPVEMEFQLFWT